MNPLRPALLVAARSPRLKGALTSHAYTHSLVRRFVAGDERNAVLSATAAVLSTGRRVTVDYLGEDITDRADAAAVVAEYRALIGHLGTAAGDGATEVSVKPSALGRSLPRDGTRIAADNLAEICAAANDAGVLVTVDAEDHTATDDTLAMVATLRADHPWLGVVVQARLRRTEADCKKLNADGIRVRLCKGAYREPKSVAYQSALEVDRSYLRCLEVLMRGTGYPMVASHDPAMIEAAHRLIHRYRLGSTEHFEHQMLFGIRDTEQRRLAETGYRTRVYIPYGTDWYGYFMRRLAERPANLTFFLRALAERPHRSRAVAV